MIIIARKKFLVNIGLKFHIMSQILVMIPLEMQVLNLTIFNFVTKKS